MDENANKASHEPRRRREAKARLSEVVRRALAEERQHVGLGGAPAAVSLSEQDYCQLTSGDRPLSTISSPVNRGPMIWSKRSMIGGANRIGRTRKVR